MTRVTVLGPGNRKRVVRCYSSLARPLLITSPIREDRGKPCRYIITHAATGLAITSRTAFRRLSVARAALWALLAIRGESWQYDRPQSVSGGLTVRGQRTYRAVQRILARLEET